MVNDLVDDLDLSDGDKEESQSPSWDKNTEKRT